MRYIGLGPHPATAPFKPVGGEMAIGQRLGGGWGRLGGGWMVTLGLN